jgi:hypothetical protein
VSYFGISTRLTLREPATRTRAIRVSLGLLVSLFTGCSNPSTPEDSRGSDQGEGEGESSDAASGSSGTSTSSESSESGDETESGTTDTSDEADETGSQPGPGPECTCEANELCVLDCFWIPGFGPPTGVSGTRCVAPTDACNFGPDSCDDEVCMAELCPETQLCFDTDCSISNMDDYDLACLGGT